MSMRATPRPGCVIRRRAGSGRAPRSAPFRPDLAPRLPETTWPEERLQKVLRNYAMEYITSIVPETIAVLGPEEGGHLAAAAARLVGMHTFDEVARLLGGVEAG